MVLIKYLTNYVHIVNNQTVKKKLPIERNGLVIVLLLKLMLVVRESGRVVPLSLIPYMWWRGHVPIFWSFTCQNIIDDNVKIGFENFEWLVKSLNNVDNVVFRFHSYILSRFVILRCIEGKQKTSPHKNIPIYMTLIMTNLVEEMSWWGIYEGGHQGKRDCSWHGDH